MVWIQDAASVCGGERLSAFVACFAPPLGVGCQFRDNRVIGALATIVTRAKMAVDADLAGRAAGRQVQAAGIDDTVGMLQFATQRNCQPAVLCFHGIDRSFGRAADGEKTLPVWQLDQLRQQYAWCAKGNMDVPNRAGATIFGNRERRSVEPLGHVARLVDAQKEELYAAPSVTLQGCQALSCLFDGNSKGSSQ